MKEPATKSSSNMDHAKKTVSHMEIRRSQNGGYILTTHHENFNHAPAVHTFGKGEHMEAHEHIAKTMKMPLSDVEDSGYGEQESPQMENARSARED